MTLIRIIGFIVRFRKKLRNFSFFERANTSVVYKRLAMPSAKRVRESNNNDELIRSLADLKSEIKKLRRANINEKDEQEEVVVEIKENFDAEKRFIEMEKKMNDMATAIQDIKEFLFQNATGARPFINQQAIMKAMLSYGTSDYWKSKAPKELAAELTTVQRSLNEKKQFEAASELQGLVEVAEMAREVVLLNSAASGWIKKALDDAIGTVLCLGKEKRGQAIFWQCVQRQLIEKVAEQEKKASIIKPKNESSSSGAAEIPCRNCIKNGLHNQFHTVSECAKRKNPCRIECAFCTQDPSTKEFPCHWRDDCPTLRRRERSNATRNFGYNR